MIDRAWRKKYCEKLKSAEGAVSTLKNGDRIFIGSGASKPQKLIQALLRRGDELLDTEIIHILTLGIAPYMDPKFEEKFRHNAFFIGDNTRKAVNRGRADYTPIFLRDTCELIESKRVHLDAALIKLSPPDTYGFSSFGVSIDITKPAAESAEMVIAEINPEVPRTCGDTFINLKDVDVLTESHEPLSEILPPPPDEISERIGRYVSHLVEDESTIQVGIGKTPNSVLPFLSDKKDLGVHTEIFSDGMLPLIKKGVITNEKKTLHKGKVVASLCMGSKKLYDFVDENPLFEFHPINYVNNPEVIVQNGKMVSINSALEIDLTGQVAAESLGFTFYSGFGGHVSFSRGAARSEGGKPIIALPSTAKEGKASRIVPHLQVGSGVTLTRGDTHYVVTEWGAAYLHGKTIRERALSLISIAHPRFRRWLLKEAKRLNYVYSDVMEDIFASQYPDQFEKRIFAKGRDLLIRPIKVTDEGMLREHFYSLSEISVYRRFLQPTRAMPHRDLQRFLHVDYKDEMALVAVDEGREEILGVSRYTVNPTTNMAEVAIVIRDDWQGEGLGKELYFSLVEIAKKNWIRGITAEILEENTKALTLFEKVSYPVKKQLMDGLWRVSFHFW